MIEIETIEDPRLDFFTKLSEVNLYHYYEPKPGLFLAESTKVLERALDAGFEPVCALVEDKVYPEVISLFRKYDGVHLDSFGEVSVYVAPFETLKQITGYHMTGGVICVMHRKKLMSVEELCKNAKRIAVLENVVNPTNIGAIFRNAAGLGIDGVLLSPGCCDPLYKRAIRVSMGTVFQIPWTFAPKSDRTVANTELNTKSNIWPDGTLDFLHKEGFALVAMALDERAISIKDDRLRKEEKKAILLGTEGTGLEDETLNKCDYTVMIPMSHGVDSLNVAAASALAFWELAN